MGDVVPLEDVVLVEDFEVAEGDGSVPFGFEEGGLSKGLFW